MKPGIEDQRQTFVARRRAIHLSFVRAGRRMIRCQELGKMLEKVMREHPDADRDTVWRFLRDLEDTPEEWLWRALRLGRYAVSKKLR